LPETDEGDAKLRYFVTGAAGFIGSNLVDRLLADGHQVIGFDNLSTGRMEFLQNALESASFDFIQGDLLDKAALSAALNQSEMVFHLAANADVRFGTQHPSKDLEQNTIATFNVLEAMRENDVHRIAFSSTGSVYGEARVFPTPEDAPFPIQTSLYGASKLACEGLIEAYCEGFGFKAFIFRFVSILGERYSHGHVFDFYKKLNLDPTRLSVLGDGHQKKSYLYVQDCIDAILMAAEQPEGGVQIYNLGTDDYCEVDQSIRWICDHLELTPLLEYTGGDRGWIGDIPFIFLDCSRIRGLGWEPRVSIQDGVIKTLQYLQDNEWLLKDSE
jgi:UDP-glucose 4-epimerase